MVQLAAEPVSVEGARPRQADERPHASAIARMHPLTLRFSAKLESEFRSEYYARTLGHVRFALALAVLLYTVFGVLDLWIAPAQRRELWLIRYAIVSPAVLATLWFTYSPAFNRFRELALSVIVLIASLGIVAMTSIIPPPGSYLYYAGLLLAVMYAFTLVRLPPTRALILSGITLFSYLTVALWLNPTAPELIVNNLFFLVSTVIIGFSANYSMERYARTNFLQRRVIEQRTAELEEKNAELIAKNRMLAESRAATIRTARRSDLIFSALSDALPGTVLDEKYRVQEKIGAGSFGTVYRGEHIFLHHPVAIKVFRPAVGNAGLESLDRFRAEGVSACRINHPNAVTVLDFDVSAGSLAYLVMELLQGHSLADELRKTPRIDRARCVRITAAVCDVLAEAHAAGIVHRDIKPSNVFLHQGKGEEMVKVIDFGIAKLTDESAGDDARTVTIAGHLVGTPEYMAPERVSGEPYDGRADVYAVGVMLYEMLTGQLPFQSKDGGHWSTAMMHVSRTVEPLSKVEPSVPPQLDALVLRTLSKAPAARPAAAELATELRAM
jgi:hypothetical protein